MGDFMRIALITVAIATIAFFAFLPSLLRAVIDILEGVDDDD